MNIINAVTTGFKKYATFSGRATRSEYWYWSLFFAILSLLTSLLDNLIFQIPINQPQVFHPIHTICLLFVVLPTIAVAVRRLHDVNHSGWWFLIGLTLIGLLFPLLIWNCTKGTQGPNQFGPPDVTVP